jgi:DNA-binding LytR/AlgR family response regulator
MPDPLRLLIADDEDLARKLVRAYVARLADATIAGECRDGDQLAAALPDTAADVLLLDIRMPGANVFDVLERRRAVAALPLVIFATAYDEYAVRAFELNAVDYLLKPFAESRLAEALTRARTRLAEPPNLATLLRDLGPRPDRILVPSRGRMIPIPVADILWIKAEGDYARIHTPAKSFLITRTLTDLESRLDPMQFLRIHRSAIVRSDKIREVTPEGSSRYRVVLEDGTALIVSRGRAAALRKWML